MIKLKDLKGKLVHFVGIGGVSMSAVAQTLLKFGCRVQGSDISKNSETEILERKGIKVFSGHHAENLGGADVVVYTSAVHDTNEELFEARRQGLMCLKRAEVLGLIASEYRTVIAVAGSHGKTTATAMIFEIFMQAGLKPTIHVGGTLKKINSNYKLGNKKFFIVEACEYKDNFLNISPDIAVILNIDSDHLDYFHSLDGVKRSFEKFAKNTRAGGIVVSSRDDKNSKQILKLHNISTFGKTKCADMYAKNIREYKQGYFAFDMMFCGFKLGSVELNIFGEHNVSNALAAALVALSCGVDFCDIKFALENFVGAKRRGEKVGNISGAAVYHDYAHHPAQINKMIEAAKKLRHSKDSKIIVAFEPHTYSRTKFLFEDFAKSFEGANHVIFLPAYSAREDIGEGTQADALAEETKKYVHETEYILTYREAHLRLERIAECGDIVLILGAGTIEKLADMFR